MTRLERGPRRHPRFVGRIDQENPIQSVVGMSGGPIFGFKIDGKDVFSYHSSAIAEFLNNIRWGIYEYLRPEFLRSFTSREPGESIAYHFKYPAGSQHPIGKTLYWSLMNDVRTEPLMPRFDVTRFLKMRY